MQCALYLRAMTTAAYCEVWGRTDEPCTRPECAICVAERNRRADPRLSGKFTTLKQPEQKFDPVNKPAHYNAGGVECIDALAAATINLTGLEAVCTANAIKYLWRWKMKNGVEDLRKAIWYIDRLLKEYPEQVAKVVHGAAQPPFVPQTSEVTTPDAAGEWFSGSLGKGSRRLITFHEQVKLMNQRADSDNHRPLVSFMWDDAKAEDRVRVNEHYFSQKTPPGPPNPPPKPPGNKVG